MFSQNLLLRMSLSALVFSVICGVAATAEPPVIMKGHSGPVTCLAFSPDGKTLGTAGKDGTVILWDVKSGMKTFSYGPHKGTVFALAISKDGKKLAVGSATIPPGRIECNLEDRSIRVTETLPDGEIKIWHTVKNWKLATLEIGHDVPSRLAFTTDGRNVIVGGGYTASIAFWNLRSGREKRRLLGPTSKGSPIHEGEDLQAFTDDGQVLAWATPNGTIHVRRQSDGNKWNARHSGPYLGCLVLSSDGKMLGTICNHFRGNDIRLWDVSTGRQLADFSPPQDLLPIGLSLNPDASIVVLAKGTYNKDKYQVGEIQFWDVKSHKLLATLEGQKQSLSSMAFSPDGRLLAASTEDGNVMLWRVPPIKKN
jgi:WD40 repeat protein